MRSRKSTLRNSLRFENMEARQLMAADISFDSGTGMLEMTGTDQADVMEMRDVQVLTHFEYNGRSFVPVYHHEIEASIKDTAGNYRLDADGRTLRRSFDAADVRQITADGLDGNDRIRNYTGVRSTLIGSFGNDVISGGSANDQLNGGPGNDTIFGGLGNDSLIGGSGNDYLYGQFGSDYYEFNAYVSFSTAQDGMVGVDLGRDIVVEDAGNDFETLSFEGQDTGVTIDLALTGVYQQVSPWHQLRIWNGNSIEAVYGTIGRDTILGNAKDNVIWTGAGNDVLEGRAGDDTLLGDRGADRYVFGADAAGSDRIFEDTTRVEANRLDFSDYHSAIAVNLFSTDEQSVDSNGGLTLQLDSATSIRDVVGTDFDDGIFGNALDNRLFGRGGNDNLSGAGGNDQLYGQAGNDNLNGGAGNDFLSGSTGNDNLFGDTGADRLFGGSMDDQLFGDTDDTTLDGGTGWDYHRRSRFWFWWG